MSASRWIDVPYVPRAYHASTAISVGAGALAALALAHDAASFALAWFVGLAAAIAVALLMRVLTGEERFTWYHYQFVAIGAAALAARSLPVLDAFVAGLAVTHATGRIGCLLAGCCHGRPARVGIRYGAAHAANGFASHFAGVTLVPTQAIESIAELALGAWCAVDILGGARAGTALVHYLAGYAVIRFALELLRGDARPSWRGVSEAQWTAMFVIVAVAIATRAPLAIAAAASMIAAGVAIASMNRDAVAADSIARALASLREPHDSCVADAGSLRISCGEEEGHVFYTLSSLTRPLRPGTLRRVARLLRNLGAHDAAPRLVAGRFGIVHVVFGAAP